MAEPGLGLRLRRARRRLMFLGVQGLLRTAGFKRARMLGAWFGDLQFRFARRRRLRLQSDVAAALARDPGDAGVRALLREAYRVNNGAVFEILALFDRKQAESELAARAQIDGLEHLHAAMAAGRGAILLGAHMGNPALLPIALAHAGWPVSVVYKQSRMASAGFFAKGLERYGIQPILANAGIRAYAQMLAACKQGRIVFMMLDQGVKKTSDGLPQRFLGKDVPMAAGPAQLARTAHAPLLPVATTAAEPRWRFVVGPPVPLGTASLEADVASLVALTEQQVLAHPQLWSWHHRRWRKFPVASRR